MRRVGRTLLGVVLLSALASTSVAHPLAPALLELTEADPGRVEVRFKTSMYPPSRAAAERLVPILPDACSRAGPGRTAIEGGGRVQRFELACTEPLPGSEVGVAGLAENAIDALLRVELADGRSVQRVLRADRPTLVVPARPDAGQVFLSYLDMGVRHIFSGIDHLLFVFGLVLLVAAGDGYLRRLLITLSAFTVGHCVTLTGAVFGWIRLPSAPVEFLIALSVLALAVELARGEHTMRATRLPWMLAGGFGLLHGLGFAGALLEAGLPEGDILLALLSFNVGIEAGQVLFVGVVLVATWLVRVARLADRLPQWSRQIPVYAMGSLAAMWCYERLAVIFR